MKSKILFVTLRLTVATVAIAAGLQLSADAQTVLPATVPVPWGIDETLYGSFTHVLHTNAPGYSGNVNAFRLAFSGNAATDTFAGAAIWKLWYQVADPVTGEMSPIKQLIQFGAAYSSTHPIAPVYIQPGVKQNSFVMSATPPITLSDGRVAVPFTYWPLTGNKLAHTNDSISYMRAGVLLGTFTSNRTDITWTLGLTGGLDYTTKSTRGEGEPAIAEWGSSGQLAMTIRGSNELPPGGNGILASRVWRASSGNFGATWATTRKITYDTGDFYSPSGMSAVMKNSSNGKIYWFGNIPDNQATNPIGPWPRYPLVVAEIRQTVSGYDIIKSTQQTIATRTVFTNNNIQSDKLQFSNFRVYDSPLTGQFAISVPVVDSDATDNSTHYTFYVTQLPVTVPVRTPVDEGLVWTLRYEGNVLPTAAGAIQFSSGATSQFGTVLGTPTMSTDGSVLSLSTPEVGGAAVQVATMHPTGVGTNLNLDPAVGYTVEFRARLNSITGVDQMVGGASVQVANGTTGANLYTISLVDTDGPGVSGKVAAWSGATVNTPYSIPDGFHTYRLTVFQNIARLYIDGILHGTDLSGGNPAVTTRLRIGDLTNASGADWDVDYLRVYDQGAIAPLPPL